MAIAELKQLKAIYSLGVQADRDDVALQLALDSAIDQVTAHTGRTFAVPADGVKIYEGCASYIVIDDVIVDDDNTPIIEQSYDQTTWSTVTTANLEPTNETVRSSLWSPTRRLDRWVRVTGSFGWPAVPAAVTQATLLMAARLFERKSSTNGVAFGNDLGIVRVSRFEDPDVERLLAPWRHPSKLITAA